MPRYDRTVVQIRTPNKDFEIAISPLSKTSKIDDDISNVISLGSLGKVNFERY